MIGQVENFTMQYSDAPSPGIDTGMIRGPNYPGVDEAMVVDPTKASPR